MDEVKQLNAEEVSVWKRTTWENASSLINGAKVAKAESEEMSVELNFILVCFEGLLQALQILCNANVERKVRFTDGMAKIRNRLESGCSNYHSEYSVKISKLERKV